MKYTEESVNCKESSFCDFQQSNLRIDCKNCFGFCCAALYFSASDGFPADKEAGKPCINLQPDFCCSVHKDLRSLGLKGCTAYDCFGAGQKVAQLTYAGQSWRESPHTAKQMFDVFLMMRQLHEMLWYLADALELPINRSIQEKVKDMIIKTEQLTHLKADCLISLDVLGHRANVNALLRQVSEFFQNKGSSWKTVLRGKRNLGQGLDLIGADLKGKNLRDANLRGAYMIAADLRGADLSEANLIGADLRDADLRAANLAKSIFLTQAQINTAKGDYDTKLPRRLIRPGHW